MRAARREAPISRVFGPTGGPTFSRTSTLPRSSRATRRGSRPKNARSKGRIVASAGSFASLRMPANLNPDSLSPDLHILRQFQTLRGDCPGSNLNRLGLRVPGGGNVRWRIVERLAGFVGKLLILPVHFPDGVMPAVVPTDASLASNHRPLAVEAGAAGGGSAGR